MVLTAWQLEMYAFLFLPLCVCICIYFPNNIMLPLFFRTIFGEKAPQSKFMKW